MANPWNLTLSVLGVDTMAARLRRLVVMAPQVGGQALHEEATDIFNRSQRLVPVRTGALKGSGYVAEPKFTGSEVSVELGYGGPAAPYATIVHERTFRTNREGDIVQVAHKAPTQSKFLEDPMVDAEPRLWYRLGQRVGRILIDRGVV